MTIYLDDGKSDTEILSRLGLTIQDVMYAAKLRGAVDLEVPEFRKMDLTQAIDNFFKIKEKKSSGTIHTYQGIAQDFKRFIAARFESKGILSGTVCDITKPDLEAFLNSTKPKKKKKQDRLAGKQSPRTFNKKLSFLRGLFGMLVDDSVIRKSPAQQIDWLPLGTKPVKFLDKDMQAKVLETALMNRETGLRDYFLLFLALNSGLRLAELVSLRICQISDVHKSLKEVLGKGNKQRDVFLHDLTLLEAEKYITVQFGRDVWENKDKIITPLFVNSKGKHRGERLSTHAAEKVVERVFEACGIEGEGAMHRLRHSYAVNLLEDGVSIVHIAHQLGHANITTTVDYLRLCDKQILEAIAKSHPFALLSIDNVPDILKGKKALELKKALEEINRGDSKPKH